MVSTGYQRIGFGGKQYAAHRVAWMLTTGEWPDRHIDHINGMRDDNRFSNLRLATHSENQMNRRPRGVSGKGATQHSCGKFQASIKKDGTTIYLGLYDTRAEAQAAYRRAATTLFKEFARTERP